MIFLIILYMILVDIKKELSSLCKNNCTLYITTFPLYTFIQDMADLQGYIQLFLIFALSTILLQSITLRRRKQNHPLHLPPSPLAVPIIGHLHLLSPTPHQDFHNLSTHYGPIIYLYFSVKNIWLV